MLVPTLESFAAKLMETFGLWLPVRHVFSCEKVDMKQQWIHARFPQAVLFPDLAKLPEPLTEDWRGRQTAVPRVMFFACGIECDSISALSSARKNNWKCVSEQGTDTATGTV